MRILLIEDDEALRAVLLPVLEEAGFGCDEAADGTCGLELLLHNPYDVAVVDRMLPGMDGLAVMRAARKRGVTTPVLMLTALDRVGDRVEGLDAGADDYLTKPFDNRELIARLRALGRRPADTLESGSLRRGDLSLDTAALTLAGPAGTARLSKNENALLEALLRRAGQLVSREALGDYKTSALIDKLYAGSAKDLVAALVERSQLSAQDLEDLRTILYPEEEGHG